MTEHVSSTARILVVDDDPGLLVLITKMLERVGPKPMIAETGTGAMAILEREDIDLLILDLMLPDIDGFDVLQKIRADGRYAEMPILILSARVDPEAIKRGLDLGADAYLTKPYLPNSLVQQVRTLVEHGRRTHSQTASG
jgi:DNA-binding response OmpR family regulator